MKGESTAMEHRVVLVLRHDSRKSFGSEAVSSLAIGGIGQNAKHQSQVCNSNASLDLDGGGARS